MLLSSSWSFSYFFFMFCTVFRVSTKYIPITFHPIWLNQYVQILGKVIFTQQGGKHRKEIENGQETNRSNIIKCVYLFHLTGGILLAMHQDFRGIFSPLLLLLPLLHYCYYPPPAAAAAIILLPPSSTTTVTFLFLTNWFGRRKKVEKVEVVKCAAACDKSKIKRQHTPKEKDDFS